MDRTRNRVSASLTGHRRKIKVKIEVNSNKLWITSQQRTLMHLVGLPGINTLSFLSLSIYYLPLLPSAKHLFILHPLFQSLHWVTWNGWKDERVLWQHRPPTSPPPYKKCHPRNQSEPEKYRTPSNRSPSGFVREYG